MWSTIAGREGCSEPQQQRYEITKSGIHKQPMIEQRRKLVTPTGGRRAENAQDEGSTRPPELKSSMRMHVC